MNSNSGPGPRPEFVDWDMLPQLIAWFERKGELFTEQLPPARCRRRLRYADGVATTLDLLLPQVAAEPLVPPPLLLYFHGGYWQAGSAREALYLGEPLLAAGLAVAFVDYDLAPAITLDMMVGQAAAALAWCFRNAEELGVDRRRIVVAGHSCGGHLAAELLATNFAVIGPDLPPCPAAAIVSFSGVFDLEQHMLHPTTAELKAQGLNAATRLDADAARRLSPYRKMPTCSIPVVLFVGEREEEEFHRDHVALSAAWSPLLALEGTVVARADHFSCLETLADPESVAFTRVVSLCMTGQ